jgi:predicted CXXCH cytochrome family protein
VVPHGPFATGACAACHDPHESDFAGLLRGGDGADHCFLCHDDLHTAMTTARRVHAPAAQQCTICHAPHGSDHPFTLKAPVDESCYECHRDVEETVAGAEAPHGAMTMADGCVNCHDAHASSHPSLLRDRQDMVCLTCHDREVEAADGRMIPGMGEAVRDRPFRHGPVRSGQCTVCHNVHGSSHARLLRARFTESFYASFDLSQYALCFECHESELVTEEYTESLTDFRDGDRNLHYLHVNRQEKGRTCRACHEIHGSSQPAHLAESVPFEGSGWALPIGFERTDTGGSCAPGCHKKMGYSRTEAIWPSGADAPDDETGGSP